MITIWSRANKVEYCLISSLFQPVLLPKSGETASHSYIGRIFHNVARK